MSHKILKACVIPAIILLPACASVGPDNSVDMEARSLITSTDGNIYVPQSEISVDIIESTAASNASLAAAAVPGIGVLIAAAAGGAGAAIDAGINVERQKSANITIEPFRQALANYDFATTLTDKVSEGIKEIEWLNVRDFSLDRSEIPPAERISQNYQTTDAAAYMSVFVDYAITADLKNIEIDAVAQVFPKTTELDQYKHTPEQKGKSLEKGTEILDTLYYRTFKFSAPIPVSIDMAEIKENKSDYSLSPEDRQAVIAQLESIADSFVVSLTSSIENPDLPSAN